MSLLSWISGLFSRRKVAASEVWEERAEIAVVNLSTRLSADDVARMAEIIEAQDREDFAPSWGCAPCPPKVYASVDDVPPGTALILLLPKSDVPGAAGYHTEDADGRISGVVAVDALLDAGWSLYDGPNSILACWSHEHCEARKDPYVNAWMDMPNGDQDAFEMCDRVQSDTYRKRTASGAEGSVSNFLLPHSFDGSAHFGVKFDFMGVTVAPFQLSPNGGCYASRRKPDGTRYQVGERQAEKSHAWSRTAQRQAPKVAKAQD